MSYERYAEQDRHWLVDELVLRDYQLASERKRLAECGKERERLYVLAWGLADLARGRPTNGPGSHYARKAKAWLESGEAL